MPIVSREYTGRLRFLRKPNGKAILQQEIEERPVLTTEQERAQCIFVSQSIWQDVPMEEA